MIDFASLVSPAARDLKPSGIRKFFDIASTVEGAISLGVGEPDFSTPWRARRAGINALERGYSHYTSNIGLPDLRKAISKYLDERFSVDYGPDEILITVGGSEAVDAVLRGYVGPGDEVIIPEPCFVCYAPLVSLAGGTPVSIATKAEDEFRLLPEQLKSAITSRTKMLILSYPNNPTGAVMSKEDYEGLAELLRESNILVLSDEIYAELTYGCEHVSFAAIPGMRERTILVGGFSKSFAMTGWRLGYAALPAEMMGPILKIHQYAIMCAPTMSQFAALEALNSCLPDTQNMREEYNVRRIFMLEELRAMGLDCFEPKGAFYLFPSVEKTGLDGDTFCEALLHTEKLAIVPGSSFGECGRNHVRISYSYSMRHLSEAVSRLRRFIETI